MNYPLSDIIEYLFVIIDDFAGAFNLTDSQAYNYIRNHNGINFVKNNYGVMHTLDYCEAVESVAAFCRRNGGKL